MEERIVKIIESIKRNEEQGIYFRVEELNDIFNTSLDELIELSLQYEYEYYSKIHQWVYFIDFTNNVTIHII